MNPRILLALSISAGMALLVSAIFYQIAVRDRGSPVEEVQMKEIVVAAQDLEIGSTITPSDLKMDKWPENKIPQDAFVEIEELVERVPISRILASEPISGRRLAPPGSGFGLAPKIPPGMRAMPVRVDDVIGISGFVLPEARVDVLVTGNPRRGDSMQMTKTILSNVRVMSAGENLEPDSSGHPQRVTVVTLLVTPQQAELLTQASGQGRLQLVLRNSRDDEVAKTRGVRDGDLFAGSLPQQPTPPRRTRRPVAQVVPPPPPPPLAKVEMIRGTERTTQTFTPGGEASDRE